MKKELDYLERVELGIKEGFLERRDVVEEGSYKKQSIHVTQKGLDLIPDSNQVEWAVENGIEGLLDLAQIPKFLEE